MSAVDPRPLSDAEIAMLDVLLPPGGFPDADVYRRQVDHLLVVARCDCGCPTVDFRVDHASAPRARFHGNPLLPVEGRAGEGAEHVELILFASVGWLESLELVSYTETPPAAFPDPAAVRLVTLDHGRLRL